MIEKIIIEGFGGINKLEFPVGPLNTIVGPNGYGKSSLLKALAAIAIGKIAESDIRQGSDIARR